MQTDSLFPRRAIYTGDNLPFLRSMNSGIADLIYLDPPFNSGKQWANPVRAAGRLAMAEFKDTWDLGDIHADHEYEMARHFPEAVELIDAMARVNGESWKAYLIYMGVRLMEMRRVLKKTGSIYYHCDPVMSHGVKLLMDSIFGGGNFQNEIVWGYEKPRSASKIWRRNHDIVLFYSKGGAHTFNVQRVPTLDGKFELRKPFKRPDGSVWNAKLPGKQAGSWWYDIPSFATRMTAKERTGYPTQKPVALLERIIKASSNAGDLIVDPFCGCATTCLAAEKLGRNWLGMDLSEEAARLVVDRLRQESDRVLVSAADDIAHLQKLPKRTDLDGLRTDDRILRPRLYKYQNEKCRGCERGVDLQDMENDHIIARKRGGQDIDDNIQLLCARCNRSKGDRGMDYLRRRILQQRTEEEMQNWRRTRNAA